LQPLKHAAETIRPLCNATGLDIQVRNDLRELSFGKWEGMAPREVNQQFHDDYIRWLADPAWNSPTQGEKRNSCCPSQF
jgi:alpha-ribazole phosphatase